jgi:hypothetical protein
MGILSDFWEWVEEKIEQVKNFVVDVWDNVVMPILEEVFSWFGIVDYTIVTVQKISNPIFADAVDDGYDAAIVKAILAMTQNGAGFFRNYMQQVNLPRAQMLGYFRYGELGQYINDLPEMVVKGQVVDLVGIKLAIQDALGGVQVPLSVESTFPDGNTWWQYYLQENYSYHPYPNTLTYPDQNGTPQSDWTLDLILYQSGTDEWDMDISRDVDETKIWITGPTELHEGDTGTYRIRTNRIVPTGKQLIVNLAYSGTAVDGTDFTAVASVTLLENTNFIDFDIVTIGDVISETLTMTVSIDSWDNTDLAFDHITVYGPGEVNTTIKDDEGLVLTIAETIVDETAGTISVPITLENATAGSFVVTATTNNGTAIAGADFTFTSTALNFTGAAGETVNFLVPITDDVEDDDNQYFTVSLSGCTDPLVDQSQIGTVWIRDYTDLDPPAVVISDQQKITQPNYVSKRHLIVTRRENSDPVNYWYWWLYDYDDGTYPDIAPTGAGISSLDIMPIAILRRNKQFINETSIPQYDSAKILVKRLGMDIDDIMDNLAENPDIDIIESCYINFAISPMDTGSYISKMLYIWWRTIIVDYAVLSNNRKYSGNLTEGDVNNSLVWTEHVHQANIAGTVTTVGSYTHDIVDTTDVAGACKMLRCRYQHSAGQYDEIRVYRLNSMSAINYGGYHQMAVSTCDGIDESFTIPVSWIVMEELNTKEQVQAYQHILRLDMYAIQITEMEWYEDPAFLDLFSFVMIVVTIWTAGLAGGFLAIIQQLAINYLLIELVIFVAEATGSAELAAVVGIVAAIALGSAGAMPAFDFTSATDLINISSKFADNLSMLYSSEAQELAAEIQEVNREAEEAIDEIMQVQETTRSPIDTAWLAALQSASSNYYMALEAQYDFDQIFSYDRLIADYHDNQLRTGVV